MSEPPREPDSSMKEPPSHNQGETAPSSNATTRDVIFDQGWRRGSVLPVSLHSDISRRLGAEASRGADRFLLVSQDCDVVCRDFGAEPCAEVAQFRVVEKPMEDWLHLRNPRVLHVEVEVDAEKRFAEFWARDRGDLYRSALVTAHPDSAIQFSAKSVEEVSLWLSRRYDRTAFPDEFNRRLEDRRKALRKFQKLAGDALIGIYVRLSTFEELAEAEPYELIFRMVMRRSGLRTEDAVTDFRNRVYNPLINSLSSLEGIAVVDHMWVLDDQFTFADFEQSDLLDFDFDLSFAK